MKNKFNFRMKPVRMLSIFLIVSLFYSWNVVAMFQQEPSDSYIEIKGEVLDIRSSNPISAAYLSIGGTHISTVSNTEGQFSLKIPQKYLDDTLSISAVRYQTRSYALNELPKIKNVIMLEEAVEILSEVHLFSATNPRKLIYKVLEKRGDNYLAEPAKMTAFYRESIKKRRRNVSLAEAVVSINKKPFSTRAEDKIAIVKARKTADYDRLDTLALKFRGGPYNTLYIDMIKYPERVLDPQKLTNYEFRFEEPTKINDRYLYVVHFEGKDKNRPWYYGRLYVDAESLTLVKASFNLNMDNKKMVSEMLVKKKPNGTKVRPVELHYEIDYRERNGKWFYGYGSTYMELVVNWRRKLFNSRYSITSEMAITNWNFLEQGDNFKDEKYIDDKVVMSDDISGFADAAFWGDSNIIEPDKSIQSAIEKIQERMNFR